MADLRYRIEYLTKTPDKEEVWIRYGDFSEKRVQEQSLNAAKRGSKIRVVDLHEKKETS